VGVGAVELKNENNFEREREREITLSFSDFFNTPSALPLVPG